jgi:alkylation response protein AidB-like acyl-CoA dehydrogenase
VEEASGVHLGEDSELEMLRRRVREVIELAAPPSSGRRAGVRAPEPAEIPGLRAWTATLYGEQLLGADWPVDYGGLANPHPQHEAIVFDELARAGAPGPIGGGTLAAAAIIEVGTEAQKQQFLPRIRSGQDIWCQLFSEPEAGSDLASLRTRARRDGDDYVVDGQKVWTTNGQHADLGYLLARTDPDAPKQAGITAFALDMRTPGVTVRPLREMTGTSDFNEVFLDDVRIPVGAVIGAVNDGWSLTLASLAKERSGVGGGARHFSYLDDLMALARRVTIDGKTAIDRDDVRQSIGGLVADVHVNALVSTYGESRRLSGTGDAADAPVSKILFSEMNMALIEYGMMLQGQDGVRVDRDPKAWQHGWWQDAFLYSRAFTIAGGTNEILRNLIAERALRLPKG